MTTLNGLRVLIHLLQTSCHVDGIPHADRETLSTLERNDMIEYRGNIWSITEKGRVFMRAVQALPLPILVEREPEWKMPK